MGSDDEKEYALKYDPLVKARDVGRLDSFWLSEIQNAIGKKLTTRPDLFGKPLRESLSGLRSLRVGDYRIVYEIRGSIVYVFGIVQRSYVYDEIAKRLGL
jgi:mRNA interferase RelE/StbE